MKYKITKKEGTCEFEEYNKEIHDMTPCSCNTKVKVGHK